MIGLKGLKIARNGIFSPTHVARWRDGGLQANHIPTEHNSSGIYTTIHLAEAASYSPYVFAVEGWGNVVMGTDGFRSQFARAIACLPLTRLSNAQKNALERLRIPILNNIDQLTELIPHMSKPVEDGLYVCSHSVLIYRTDGGGRYRIDRSDRPNRRFVICGDVDQVDIDTDSRPAALSIHGHVGRLNFKGISAVVTMKATVDHAQISLGDKLSLGGNPRGRILEIECDRMVISASAVEYERANIIASSAMITSRRVQNVRIKIPKGQIWMPDDRHQIDGPDHEGWLTIQPKGGEK